MNIKRLPMIYRYLLYLGLSFFILSLGYAAPTFNAATHDTPIDEVVTFTGTNKVVVGGISLYPTLTSNTFTVDIPACASGNPTITAAYLNWFHRSGIVDTPNSGGFDPTVDLSINAGATQSLTADQNYHAGIQYDPGYNDYYHLLADITSQLQNNLVAGSNSFSVNGIDVPTAGTWLRQNFGTGVTVIYSCPEYPYTKTSFFAGNDFFFCGNPYSGEYSSSYCMEFPASSNPRGINLEALYGGQTGSQPLRGGTYSYTTGTGSAPPMDGTTAFATGTIWNAANASVNPAWTSNLGTEWDKLSETVTIPANHTYMCMQSRSHEDANAGTGQCISLNHAAFTFSIPVDPPSASPDVDIEVRKVVNPASVQSGDTATYTVEVINNGPDQATNIEVVEQLPNGVSYVAPHTASQGSYDVATGVWTVGTLANGANATLTINVTAD